MFRGPFHCALWLALFSLTASGCASADLHLSLELDRDVYEEGDAVEVVWTVTNETARSVPFLAHGFPSIWVLDDDGEQPEWIGPADDHRNPVNSDVRSIGPYSSLNGRRTLSDDYALAVGHYTVRSENSIVDHPGLSVAYWIGELDAVAVEFDVR